MNISVKFISFLKRSKTIIYIVFIAIIPVGKACVKSFDKPTWEAEYALPLLETNMRIEHFLTDTSLQTGKKDSLFFIESLPLPALSLDSLVSMDVQPFIRNISMDNLVLANQRISETIYLGDIIESEGLTGLFPDGSSTFMTLGPIPISETSAIDASAYFEDIHIKNGNMSFLIINDFPADMENVSFEIQNQNGGETIETDNIALLSSGESVLRHYNLAEKQVEGTLRILYSFEVTLPAGTLIDYQDSIHMAIELEDLDIYSANAIFPEQELLHHQEVVYLEDMDDIELTRATIQEGNLLVQITSTIEQETYLRYTIPKATLQGVPFSQEVTIPAAPPGGVTQLNEVFPFDNYDFDFTGKNGDTVNAFYNEVQAWIDSTGEIVHLTLADSIDLRVEVKDLVPDYVEGYLGTEQIDIGPDTLYFPDSQLPSGESIHVKGARLQVQVNNETGIPGSFSLLDLRAYNDQSMHFASLITDQLQNKAIAANASTILPITDDNANPSELINLRPQRISYALQIAMNPAGNNGLHDNFASLDQHIIPTLDVIIPMTIRAEQIVLTDTLTFGNAEEDDPIDTKVRSGTIYIHANNYFPLSADIVIYFRDRDQNPMAQLIAKGEIQAGIEDPDTKKVTTPTQSTISLPISRDEMWSIRHAHDAIINITLNTFPREEHLHIFNHYNMHIHVSSDVIYEMDNRYNR